MTKLHSDKKCMFCGKGLDEYDLQHQHAHCHSCRSSGDRSTLARVSMFISLNEDLSTVPEWSLIRELAGRRYGHKQDDKELLERLLGFVQATFCISRECAFRMPLAELGQHLNSASNDFCVLSPSPSSSDSQSTLLSANHFSAVELNTPDHGQSVSRQLSRNIEKIEWLAKAMLVVQERPEWSDSRIATYVGKNKSTLSRNRQYQMAAALARGDKDQLNRGHPEIDPTTGLKDIEAYSPINTTCD